MKKANVPKKYGRQNICSNLLILKVVLFHPMIWSGSTRVKFPDMDCAANIGVCDSADTGSDNLSFSNV